MDCLLDSINVNDVGDVRSAQKQQDFAQVRRYGRSSS
jgi:hypothetical protein